MLLNDKQVFVGHHVSRKERSSKSDELKKQFTNIFVKNLDESIGTEQLKEMFTSFGNITSAVVAADEQGKSKVVFLSFSFSFFFLFLCLLLCFCLLTNGQTNPRALVS